MTTIQELREYNRRSDAAVGLIEEIAARCDENGTPCEINGFGLTKADGSDLFFWVQYAPTQVVLRSPGVAGRRCNLGTPEGQALIREFVRNK